MLLSIGMIVKNESKTLRDCLNGIKPILEQVESELIIADTGSEDGSAEIAREFTEKVYGIEWRGDFAWARNTTLEKAVGLWYMFLDADEVFQDVSDIIRFFNSGEYKKYRSASHFMINGENRDVFTRLYKIEEKTAFQGKIHEQIPLQPPVKALESVSVHTGYDFTGEGGAAKRAAKHGRNIGPLLEAHGESPDDLRIIALIANEYLTNEKFGEAREFIEKGLKLRGKFTTDVFYHILRHYELALLGKEKKFEEAAARAEDYFDTAKKLFVCAVNMRLVEGLALSELGRYREAAGAYTEALKLLEGHKRGKLDRSDTAMSVTAEPRPGTDGFIEGNIAKMYAASGGFEAYVSERADGAGIRNTPEREEFFRMARSAYERKNAGDTLNFITLLRAGLNKAPEMREAVLEVIKAIMESI